jgi:predicted kinase
MSELILLRGLPASGKTTWAREWVQAEPEARARVNRDDLRLALFGKATYSYAQEELITATEREAARGALQGGRDVVVDAMNLRPMYCRAWRRFALANGATFAVREFPIDLELAIARDCARVGAVGAEAIRKMHGKYMPHGAFQPIPDEQEPETTAPYALDPDLPRAVLVDIDGTLALNLAGRSPYEWARVGEDEPNPQIVALTKELERAGYLIIGMSGREDSCRALTTEWLQRHEIPFHALYMRAREDKRRDSVVKLELFDQHIRNQFAVHWVLDDRQQVVDAWRSIGLTCLQVAPGDL